MNPSAIPYLRGDQVGFARVPLRTEDDMEILHSSDGSRTRRRSFG